MAKHTSPRRTSLISDTCVEVWTSAISALIDYVIPMRLDLFRRAYWLYVIN